MEHSYQIHTIAWQGLAIEVRYVPSWSESFEEIYGHRLAHLELVQPEGRPLPVTETGYRSHFTPADEIEAAGGPVAYAVQWLDAAAQEPAWKEAQAAGRQLVLF